MDESLFRPRAESEARLLILVAAFTTPTRGLQGRTKLAKLDFLLRYPAYFSRAMSIRAPSQAFSVSGAEGDIDHRMVRYRYGPWDPAYYALLGRLVGRGLVVPEPFSGGIGYRATDVGLAVADRLRESEAWAEVA